MGGDVAHSHSRRIPIPSLLTFAGVGLRTNFVDLRRQGLRPLLVGALAEIGIAAATLAMVSAADSTFGL